jgi:serine/threonine protein kinase
MSPDEFGQPEQKTVVPSAGPNGGLSPALDDPRVVEALEQYLAAVESGEKPNRQAFLARHGEIAEALAECLDGMEALHEAAVSPNQTLCLAKGGKGGGQGISDTALMGTGECQPEAPLGDFRILREIGRGGMGIVYEAVQLSLGRRVALKVLPFAAALDAKKLRRFTNEAQAAAHLHHNNIVPVYAVGAERGVHFYAMQLIEGQSLSALIEELRKHQTSGQPIESRPPLSALTGPYLPDPPLEDEGDKTDPFPPAQIPTTETPSLGAELSTQRSERAAGFFRTIARLVGQAAEGLEYAHSLGIIHRDVKPGNLLLDVRGNIWITDFGLAQFHADAGLTQSGDLLGTLRYMSPEQAGGQRALIDHRTDVYSLGATLYELLTLRPIFDGADRQALLNQILYEEPRPPRSIDHAIPPELETIVLKALGKAPLDRYATARELADDLQRFLSDQPIRARRPSFFEKATKWARRHRAVVTSAVIVLLLSVAGLLTSTLLIAGAYDRERQKAREADESFRQARRAVDQFVQISEAELAGKPFVEPMRKRLLETALDYYQDFIEQRRDDPSIRQELEESRANVQAIIEELATLMGANRYMLLSQPSVQNELGLSEAQRSSFREIRQRRERSFHEVGRLGPEWERVRLDLARQLEAEVSQLLDPDQLTRFKELALQSLGPAAFRESEVVSNLKLTAEQRERIRAIEATAFFARESRYHGSAPQSDAPRKSPEEARAAAMAQIRQAVLTPEQAKRWSQMTGELVDSKILVRPHFVRDKQGGLRKP